MRFLPGILMLCAALPLPALAADVEAVYADFLNECKLPPGVNLPVPPATTGTFFGGHVKFLPGPNGAPTEPSGGGYRLAESSFGQLAGFTVPYPDFEKVAINHALKMLYYDKADDSPGYRKADAAFRYKAELYSRTDGKITRNFATIKELWNEKTRERALAAAEGIATALRYSPANPGLRNALLDILYDIATAEVVLAKDLEADALKASMSFVGYTPPPGEFAITGEIKYLREVLSHYRAATQRYFDLLTDRMGVGVSIGGGDSTSEVFGYRLFHEQQPSRSLYATTFQEAGTLKPVLDQNNDGQPDRLFTGYKDLVLLFEIERDSARVAAELAKLLALRGDPGDREEAKKIVDEAQQHGYTDFQLLLNGPLQESSLTNVDGSGLKEVRAGWTQALTGLSGIESFLIGETNPLGLDPNFLVLVQNDNDDTFGYFREHFLVGGTDNTFTGAIGDALAQYNKAKESYGTFRQYQDRIGEELLSHRRQFADRLHAIAGCHYPDPPDPRSCYHTPESNPGGEIYLNIEQLKLAGLRIQKNAQEITNLKHEINYEIERRNQERYINNQIAQTYVKYGHRQAQLTEEIGQINAGQELANATAAAVTTMIAGAAAVTATLATGGAAAAAIAGATSTSTFWTSVTHAVNGAVQAGAERRKGEINAEKERQNALQSADITGLNGQRDEVNSAALVKNLLLRMSILSIDSLEASILLTQDFGRLQALLDEKSYLEAEWAEANSELSQRYFADPTHRIIMNKDILSARQAFDKAQFWVFIIARALDYKWNNNNLTYDGYNADTVFKLRNAEELADMAKAMWDYDKTHELGTRHGNQFVSFSLREDFLGYRHTDFRNNPLEYPDPVTGNQVDAVTAFRSYLKNIAPHVKPDWGNNKEVVRLQFNTAKPNFQGTFFSPDRWNEKINWVAVTITTTAQYSQLMVRLEQSGTTFIRDENGHIVTYPVHYWYSSNHSDTGQLEFRSKDTFGISINAAIMPDPKVPVESLRKQEFHEMSPAVSTWTLEIPTIHTSNMPVLDLDQVTDIEIWFYNYYFDKQ